MAKKPLRRAERIEVVYGEKRWELLAQLRSRAVTVMRALEKAHLLSITHGSIARGDVSVSSDIDVFLPEASSSFVIEAALETAGFVFSRRLLVQATPSFAPKGYIELEPKLTVSFPLMKMRRNEREFYQFGGEANLQMLLDNVRAAGVDKRLMLIEPTTKGHVESTITDKEETVAHLLHISADTVLDRVHALLRRDKVGRTGVYIERELTPEETFEMVVKQLADNDPAVRRRLKLYGK